MSCQAVSVSKNNVRFTPPRPEKGRRGDLRGFQYCQFGYDLFVLSAGKVSGLCPLIYVRWVDVPWVNYVGWIRLVCIFVGYVRSVDCGWRVVTCCCWGGRVGLHRAPSSSSAHFGNLVLKAGCGAVATDLRF